MAESLDPKGLPSDPPDPYSITPAADPDDADHEAPQEPEAQPVMHAFVIVVDESGAAMCTNDLSVAGRLTPTRQAGIDDMHRAILEVDRDLTIARTAQETVQLVSLQAQAMAQQQEEMALRQQVLQRPSGPRRR